MYDFEIENNSFKLLSFLKINTYYTINKKIIQLLEYYFKETSSLLNHEYIKIDTSDISETNDTKQNFIITYQNSLSEKCDKIINHIYNETFEIFKFIKKYVSKNVKNLLDYDYKKNLYIENGKEYIKTDALKFDIQQDVKLQIGEEKPPENPIGESIGEPLGESIGEPLGESIGEPLGETTGEPIREPTGEPIRETTGEPVGETTGETSGEPLGEPLQETTGEPIGEPLGEPIQETTGELSKDSEKKEMLGGKNKKTRKARY